MPVSLRCEAAGCNEVKTADDMLTCIQLMQLHQKNVHDVAESRPKPPKIDRPSLQQDIGEDDWAAFTRRWDMFLRGTDVAADQVTAQLLACCEPEIESALFREDQSIASRSMNEVLAAMKRLTVISEPLSIRRSKLLQSAQQPGEHVRQYVARLRGMANVCQWNKTTTCQNTSCGQIVSVSYTDEIVKLIMMNGIVDEDIKREILGSPGIDQLSLNDTIALIDGKETAARAILNNVSQLPVAASAYQKMRQKPPPQASPPRQNAKNGDDHLNRVMRCKCGELTPRFGKVRGKVKEFKTCLQCWRSQNRDKRKYAGSPVDVIFQHADSVVPHPVDHILSTVRNDRAGTGKPLPQPELVVNVNIDAEAYDRWQVPRPPNHSAKLTAIADSGAQTCLMGSALLKRLGLRRRHLAPADKRILAANNKEIHVLGALLLKISGQSPNGHQLETSSTVYVTDSTNRFYLSRAVLESLEVIGKDFPRIGATPSTSHNDTFEMKDTTTAPCGCPIRTSPPPRPERLPMTPSHERAAEMKSWLLKRYASSTFNTCPHQALPVMSGPQMEIRVDPDTQPVVTRRPPNVPVHWQKEVAAQLERDVALGVIERVPPNTPVTWLHNMVVTPKADGTPRRTVDLQPVNKYSVRETHHTVPPSKQAKAIPPNTVKTVTDAWNGFHAIEIKPEDRHKTTFLTEQGRFRYKRAPMGFLASQDAYTQRYDSIITDVPRKTKCVDDTLLWDKDITTHWWRVIDYLNLTGENGVILNPTKFQFSSKRVQFAGFEITSNEVKPLSKYLDAISTFPQPTNISDIRSWFGLVNQVSHYGRTSELMEPFKPFLSPKVVFKWTADLEDAFTKSKEAIIQEIKDGVEIFDPKRRTCLSPDWSKTGIGYWLRQKYCRCASDIPGCCRDGWKITLAGSRFLRDAEKRYAPIEGEALAVAWSLEDTRFFTMGCEDLIVTTDHKPLVKILGDRALDDVANPRLFRIKQRTLMWRYRIVHVPGKSIPASDATSRNPTSNSDNTSEMSVLAIIRSPVTGDDDLETSIVAIARTAAHPLGAITWERVRKSTSQDEEMLLLSQLVENGFPTSRDNLPEALQPFWQHRNDLTVVDNVLMLDKRIVIPHSLRHETLRVLHAAHQGTSRMYSRAHNAVFWPGMTRDIEQTRMKCTECWKMSPSNARLPPCQPHVPTRPFEAVAADFGVLNSTGYLIVVDRFSGWPHVVTTKSGAQGFISAIIAYFSTFGVPREITTDGGPEFVAKESEDLLKRWGVRHRISSAYHPQSNGRAEAAVKSMKRLLTSHTGLCGNMDTEAVAAGLLQYRNTPDPDTGMSPAQIVFGHNIRDLLPVCPNTPVFDSTSVHPVWRETWKNQENALRLRFFKQVDRLDHGTRQLPPLEVGDKVLIQNQTGRHKKRWDRTGTVVDAKPHNQYRVKVDGSGRLTLRNRQFLKHIQGLDNVIRSPMPFSRNIPVSEQQPTAELNPPDCLGRVSQPAEEVDVTPRDGPPESTIQSIPDTSVHVPEESSSRTCPSKESSPRVVTPTASPQAAVRPRRVRRAPAYLKDYITGMEFRSRTRHRNSGGCREMLRINDLDSSTA